MTKRSRNIATNSALRFLSGAGDDFESNLCASDYLPPKSGRAFSQRGGARCNPGVFAVRPVFTTPMGEIAPEQLAQVPDFRRKFTAELPAQLRTHGRAASGQAVQLPQLRIHFLQAAEDHTRQPGTDCQDR